MHLSCHTPLRQWMDDHGITVTQVARAVGMQTNYVGDVANGRAFPGLVTALKIAKATGNAVPPESWLTTPEGQARWHKRDPQAPKKGVRHASQT